jgi:hypothetical protein
MIEATTSLTRAEVGTPGSGPSAVNLLPSRCTEAHPAQQGRLGLQHLVRRDRLGAFALGLRQQQAVEGVGVQQWRPSPGSQAAKGLTTRTPAMCAPSCMSSVNSTEQPLAMAAWTIKAS